MKRKKRTTESAVKAGLLATIHKAASYKLKKRTAKGPEPERFKITGYSNWEDAAAALVHKQKPAGGWPKVK